MAPSETPVLRFENVSVAFDGVPALLDVSFAAYASDTRVILGAAGSGKTVLLKTALGLVRPDAGQVFIFEQRIDTLKERDLIDLRSQMGMLFQESALFDSLNIEENVAYPLENQRSIKCPPEQIHPRVVEALEFVELGGTLEKFPSELSGGMRRRAAIARAVVTEPRLVLYDSPTAGLDPITAYTIISLILKERDTLNASALLVTHRFQDGHLMAKFRYNPSSGQIEAASQNGGNAARTRFFVMNGGRLVFEGSLADLAAAKDPYVKKFAK